MAETEGRSDVLYPVNMTKDPAGRISLTIKMSGVDCGIRENLHVHTDSKQSLVPFGSC